MKGAREISMKQKLNFRFHNPNTPEASADYIARILIEANKAKVERIIMEHASENKEDEEVRESRSVS